MGYTHYFAYAPQSETFRANWLQLRIDAAAVTDFTKASGIPLGGSGGRGAPVIGEDLILFNGRGDETCEDFRLELDPDRLSPSGPFVWGFTKTAACLYDVAVTAVLLRAHVLMPEVFAIDSDGAWADWLEARAVNQALFPDSPLPAAEPFTDTTCGPLVARH
ncbi:hypothetical protein [Streptomyces sp. NPDC047981]|uniref:hypothetical protein n=1 Tax=Streptomyces sp. NPDC047981 TaxID=3154610 RepID=UPI003427F328